MYVLIQGNPIDGLELIGPFADHDSATAFAEANPPEESWWIYEMTDPNNPDGLL